MERRERKKDLSTNMNHEAAMDNFLGKLGLYRKPIAKDGSCLFRAVAEQVFNCQAEHVRVRKECIEYMKKNKHRFEAFVEGPFDHHLFNLKSQKEWAGQVEIQALSMMYNCDFLVYKDINSVPIKATENDYEKKIILCYSNGNHYDTIYPHSHKSNLGLCQSILFEMLYGQIFPILMANDPENNPTSPKDKNDKQSEFSENNMVNGYGSENVEENNDGWTTVKNKKQGKMATKNQKNVDQYHSEQASLSPTSSKFNWEIMRSIDPDSYRNIELEVWEESRKEQQQKDHVVAATIQFKKGDRCQVKHPYDEKFYTAYIDDVLEEKCKIWIPELKERKLIHFSRLKPKEQNSGSGYRELSGYYRKQDNHQDNNSQYGGDDQKNSRRRRSNRNRKGNAGESNERNQQDMSVQEDIPSRHRGDKNRRRRNNSNTGKTRDDKKEFNQKEGERSPQDQGTVEVFPALPKREDQTTVEKVKTDLDSNTDPATFWRKRREVKQVEKVTADLKEETATCSTPNEDNLLNEELMKDNKDCIGEMHQELASDLSQQIHQEFLEKIPDDFHEVKTQVLPCTIPHNSEHSQEIHKEVAGDVEEEVADIKLVSTEKQDWQDLPSYEQKPTPYFISSDVRTNYDTTDEHNYELTKEQTTDDIFSNDKPPSFEQTVVGIEDTHCILEEGNYNPGNQVPLDTQRNFEILKNPNRQEAAHDGQPSTSTSPTFTRYVQAENLVVENGTNNEQEIKERTQSPVFQETLQNETPPLLNQNDHHEERDVSPSQDHIKSPINAAMIQNEILNGNITYSNDPEGKDLPKDMEVVRHIFNCGIYMYQCFNGMNNVFPSSAPISPMYPMMNPNTVYAMQQTYQNRGMMMSPNMYTQMQQQVHEENTQQQSSSGAETRENNDSPSYKPTISHQQSSPYHTSQAMAAAQQAMFNMNYGQVFATAGRPLYNYNMYPQRSVIPRYIKSFPFNGPRSRKFAHRFPRNDN